MSFSVHLHVHSKKKMIKDFPAGPLDEYRKKASFDWRKLKLFIETEDVINYQDTLYNEFQKYPECHKSVVTSIKELRRITTRQAFIFKSIPLFSFEHIFQNMRFPAASTRVMVLLSPAAIVKYIMGSLNFRFVLIGMGTKRHADILQASEDGEFLGCYCMTEIGHGTNTKAIRTTATYDKINKEFIMNTPDFEAAKCWAGSLGQTASYAIVMAQLILDGKSMGLHGFLVQIRDIKTLKPLPGVTVGDMGEKIGLNGVDNGFMTFNNYRLPRINLLNKVADVSEEGEYITPIKDPNKRHGASLGSLSGGRVTIATMNETMSVKALTIALRYSAVRKQFGPNGQPEASILEHETHQHRLLPYLAAAYVQRVFCTYLMGTFYQLQIDMLFTGKKNQSLIDLGMEIHAASCAAKPVTGWTSRDCIQECRECCGGHGYLKVAGIGDIRNDHDANLTYEGENHVLIQQTTNWLLKLLSSIEKGEKIESPMESVNFLSNFRQILSNRFTAKSVNEVISPESIFGAYQWLVCYLLERTAEKQRTNEKKGLDSFTAKSRSQVYFGKQLAIVYIQNLMLQVYYREVIKCEDVNIKEALVRLFSLYGVWSLEKHLPVLYQGGYASGDLPTTLIQDAVLTLCAQIKNDAVGLIDAVAPPDFILNSVLGASDGQVYKHLEESLWWPKIKNKY